MLERRLGLEGSARARVGDGRETTMKSTPMGEAIPRP